MKAPKILPWIAHKTGISEELALKLWRRAAGEAETIAGCCDSSDFCHLAMERFIDFAEAEGTSSVVRQTARPRSCVSWLWRHQNRISKLNMITLENIIRLSLSNWTGVFPGPRRSA